MNPIANEAEKESVGLFGKRYISINPHAPLQKAITEMPIPVAIKSL
jgi:hypothetical protein